MARNHHTQFRWCVFALGAIVLCAGELAFAQPPAEIAYAYSPAERRGWRFVRLHCAHCHAIDKDSASPLAGAPPFRTLRLRYPVSDLQRPLARGIHPMMPQFHLEPGQVEDIMAYLKTLQR